MFKDMYRRDFIKLSGTLVGSAFLSSCMNRLCSFPETAFIDFYGLVHFETPEANKITQKKILNVLNSKEYDLITLELPYPKKDLEANLLAQENMIDTLKNLHMRREDIETPLVNSSNYHERAMSLIQSSKTISEWCENENIPCKTIDSRVFEIKTEQGDILSTKEPVILIGKAIELYNKLDHEIIYEIEELYGKKVDKVEETIEAMVPVIVSEYSNHTGPIEKEDIFKEEEIKFLMQDEDKTAKNLCREIKDHNAINIAHFGGAAHFLEFKYTPTLYSLMKDKAICTRTLIYTE